MSAKQDGTLAALAVLDGDSESAFSVYDIDDTRVFVLRGAPPKIKEHTQEYLASLLRDPRMTTDTPKGEV